MPNPPNLPLMFHASFRIISNIYIVPFFLFLSLQAKMENLPYFKTKPQHVCSGCSSCFKSVSCSFKSTCFLCLCFYRSIVLHLNPLSVHLLYFLSFSFLGFGILIALKPRTYPSFTPRNIDLIFTSVSATTVSSMSTVEMEVFSNTQLIILTILMFIGGEVFTSMVGLHLGRWFNPKKINNKVDTTSTSSPNGGSIPYSLPRPPSKFQSRQWDQIELEMGTNISKSETSDHELQIQTEAPDIVDQDLKYKSIRFLSFLVLGFLALINVVGVGLLLVYLTVVSSAREVLRSKGIKLSTFSIFTIISTFTNCGFVPTNENMMVFSKNSVLLLILIPQVLFGNTLFAPCLRFSIWVLGKFVRRFESSCNYLLKNSKEIGYHHLLPAQHSLLLVVTVIGFILLQFILFCAMEWKSTALSGLNTFQKVVGVLFQTVNSRHTGETIVDLSTISAAVLALFVVMMYLPPYTSFVPIKAEQNESNSCPVQHQYGRKKKRRRQVVLENLILSQLSYIAIFVILICITESKSMKDDPLNFNVFAIVVEVVSAYGSVGFSIGYSCERQLKPDSSCKDKWYGFSGKWSDEGKIILIVVMLFGRLKKFNMDGGRAWKLL